MKEMILPSPGPFFEWRATAAGPALACRALDGYASHLFTTQHWLLGQRAGNGDEPAAWQAVAEMVDGDPQNLVRVRQVHGTTTVVATVGGGLNPADIIVNDDPAVIIAVQSADCVPLLIADRETGAVAAAHAGWRGMAAGVVDAVVNSLRQQYGSRPQHLVVAAGPSIGSCCYEVGRDVRAAFSGAGFSAAQLDRWFSERPTPSASNPSIPALPSERRPDHWFFDGWLFFRDRLQEAGVPPDQIFLSELCTASHPDALCSYRRDGAAAGRMAAVIKPRLVSAPSW